MGVEYKHWFIAKDLTSVGDQGTASRVHDVLLDWGLVAGTPAIYSLDGGRKKKLRGQIGRLTQPPRNMMVEYPMVENDCIKDIMGPSYYPETEIGPRYFQEIAVILGTDYRVFDGHESIYTEVVQPPMCNGSPIKPYKWQPFEPHSNDVYPADLETDPLKTSVEICTKGWPVPAGFRGIWRSGLMLFCGKDLPALGGKRIPSKRFTSRLEKAFGTKLIQIGHYW